MVLFEDRQKVYPPTADQPQQKSKNHARLAGIASWMALAVVGMRTLMPISPIDLVAMRLVGLY